MYPLNHKEALIHWITERWDILQRKNEGLYKPWSEDPTFHHTYFCNVRREDDKVTKWIRSNFLMHPEKDSLPELNMLVARLVNKPKSLEAMDWPFCKWGAEEKRGFRATMSQKGSWGSAYIVSTNGRSVPKHDYIQGLITAAHSQLEALPYTGTLANAHVLLTGIHGLGSFMAAQIVADLKNTTRHYLHRAPDWWTWAAHGPGSLRGAGWFHGRYITPKEFPTALEEIREYVDEHLNYENLPVFCNQDLQNCLCEYDKYMRVATKVGKSKRKYNGT